jgi:hypothetical protein
MSTQAKPPAEPVFSDSPFEEAIPPLDQSKPVEEKVLQSPGPQAETNARPVESQSTGQAIAMTQRNLHALNAEFNNLLALICSQCSDVVNTLHAIQEDIENR